MKKIIIAAIAFAMLVACGGSNGKKAEVTVEDKAVQLSEQLLDAMASGDEEKMEAIEEQMEEWYENPSEEDQKKADEAAEKWAEENEEKLEKAYEQMLENLL